jgi:5-amino-6-(5-phosphoribosylamino)uracil reductase
MASSIDGKITTFRREKLRFSSDQDRELMEDLRSRVDAILIGAGTLNADDPPLILRIPEYQLQRQRFGKRTVNPINVVVSANLDFVVEDSDFFNCPATEKLVFTTTAAPRSSRIKLSKYAHIIELAPTISGDVNLRVMAQVMHKLKIRSLLLEGGGSLNFSMLNEGLVDEIYLTLCPFVIGGLMSPTSFDGDGFSKELVKKVELESSRVGSQGELFLKYKVKNHEPVIVKPSATFRKGYVMH